MTVSYILVTVLLSVVSGFIANALYDWVKHKVFDKTRDKGKHN